MAERKGVLERILAGERTIAFMNIMFCGIILADFVISSHSMLENFAPLSMTSTWLYAAALICGLALGITLESYNYSLWHLPNGFDRRVGFQQCAGVSGDTE